MEFTNFVRKPFTVEAVQITEENLEEVAALLGEVRRPKDGSPYIKVTNWRVPNVTRVFPGYWMTRMGDNIRCYSKKIFTDQFRETTPEIENWIVYLNGETTDESSAT